MLDFSKNIKLNDLNVLWEFPNYYFFGDFGLRVTFFLNEREMVFTVN